MKFRHIFVAGTFDRLHEGHKKVIQTAFASADRVTIGITSDAFITTYKPKQNLFNAHKRKQNVELWIESSNFQSPFTIIPIDNPYQPVVSSREYDSLIVTEQNKITGQEINDARLQKNLPPLSLIIVDLVPAEDLQPISSTRIRQGVIDQQGKLMLPGHLRSLLQKPFGHLLIGTAIEESMKWHADHGIITIGDKTTMTARELNILPKLSVIDFQVERQAFASWQQFHFPDSVTVKKFQSGPGFIAVDVIDYLKTITAADNPHVFIIDGEDDLIALPLMVYAPKGMILYYGQPGEGVVEVVITEVVEKEAQKILNEFREY